MGLAVMNTAMSFVQIRYDRLWWLPDICWTLTIWQSWLGFWWWCGAGMGIGEVEDRAEREARRKKRREKIRRKLEKEERQRRKAEMAAEDGSDVLLGIKRIKDKITDGGLKDSTLSRRIRGKPTASAENEDIELREIATHEGQEPAATAAPDDGPPLTSVSVVDDGRTADGSSDSNPTTSAQTGPTASNGGWLGRVGEVVNTYQPGFIKRRMRRLRIAHAAAAKKAATEQTILRNQVLNANRQPGLRAMMFDGEGTRESRRGSRTAAAAATGSRRQSAANVPVLPRTESQATTTETTTTSGRAAQDTSSSSASSPLAARPRSMAPSNPFASSSRIATGAEGDQRSIVARASQDGLDDEWVDEDRGRQGGGGNGDDGASETPGSPGSPGSNTARPASREETRRALWRQGLDRARLRDRQRYD